MANGKKAAANGKKVAANGKKAAAEQGISLPDTPATLPLLISNMVLFPMSVVPLRITDSADVKLIDHAVMGSKMLAFIARKPTTDATGVDAAFNVGCVGRIMQLQRLPDGSLNVVLQALRRFRIGGVVQREPFPVVKVTLLEERKYDKKKIGPLVATVKMQMARLITLSPDIPDAASGVLDNIDDPGFLADLIASNLSISIEEKQQLLDTIDRTKRLDRLTFLLAREVEMMELSDKIRNDVRSSIDKTQREYFLRQQMKAIQDELGEGEGDRTEASEFRKKITALELNADVKKEIMRELDRFESMNPAGAEYHVLATYLDWVVELPWNAVAYGEIDIARAERILNQDHYGLDRVKRRILEHLAVRKLKPDASGAIICFVGPPGVGKTSLGQSIARALDRKFVRMSLGGMRDEAEIRGHRKTYIGAMPGRIIQLIRKAGTRSPVFMLDEIDKLGNDFRGDPSSALLEVLDPAQNSTFSDLYLNVPFDLSDVMFVATANMLDTIPWALRDRMEVIEIPGYTVEEKLNIARKYLVPRQLEAHGIPKGKLMFSAPILRYIITRYTREAGVRNLDREIANVCRGCARSFAEGRRKPITISLADISTYLGNPRVRPETAERTRIPGVSTGLAWTAVGGDILFVEATRMPGKGNLVLTGQLGDVMKESAQAVLSYVRANSHALGIEDSLFTSSDIHIHVPAGAVPKDGPSAGVTILTAVASLLTGKRVKDSLAMTGEITLRGLVLPVGGVKEKVLAAARAGIREIVLPAACEPDLIDVPASARDKLTFHFVNRMEEVLAIALGLQPIVSTNGRKKAHAKSAAVSAR
ncbi:MAG: endopeptidase La [Candidatus Hydrogenedentes bacterium]|nr:endopeptidase La [Candidatus Hydrogenedentota bacterium]